MTGHMKRIVLAVLAAGLALALAGCGLLTRIDSPAIIETPEGRYVLAAESYAAVMHTLADYREQGLIGDETADRIEEHRRIARAALDAWHAGLAEDGPLHVHIDRFHAALGVLIRERRQIEEGHDG